jgi:hypothetical protein
MFYISFIIVLLSALSTAYALHTQAPNMNGMLKFFVIPLAVGYAVLLILNNVVPQVNSAGQSGYNFVEDALVGSIASMDYFQIFPPLFAVLLIFMLLAYGAPRSG